MDSESLMRLAIEQARTGIAAGQTPFGCAIALGKEVIATAHNSVWASTDITAHAEINALRQACAHTGQVHLKGAIVATTCEPCPMCAAALHWARVETVYFGASIADATRAGFNELAISAEQLIEQGGSSMKLVPNVLPQECIALFDSWRKRSQSRTY